MKLSNQQIDSLVRKADNKRREEIKAEQEKLTKSVEKDVQKAIKEASVILEKIPEPLKDILKEKCKTYQTPGFKNVYQQIQYNIENKALKACKIQHIDTDTLRQDIILATIDAKDLTDLCNKLGLSL